MALVAGCGLFIIEKALNRVANKDSVLSLSRMSMNWQIDELVNVAKQHGIICNPEVVAKVKQNPWYTSKEFYEMLGFLHYDDIDVHPDEGVTIVHDMNQPIDEQYHQSYDFVSEVGTIEHIFDLKNVMGNIAKTLKVGGTICHLAPLDALNHGFYNFSLNFFYDFYRVNGFDEMESYLIRSAKQWDTNQNILAEHLPYTPLEFTINPDVYTSEYCNLGLGFIAKKVNHIDETQVPMQAAYDADRKIETNLKSW